MNRFRRAGPRDAGSHDRTLKHFFRRRYETSVTKGVSRGRAVSMLAPERTNDKTAGFFTIIALGSAK
jgi:hypothetical protein